MSMGVQGRVKVFTTTTCGYCRLAKNLLKERQIPFEEIDVTNDEDARAELLQQGGRRTVPVIFIDGVSIGGYQELAALARAGRLPG